MWATDRLVLKYLPSIYTSMLPFYFELCLHAPGSLHTAILSHDPMSEWLCPQTNKKKKKKTSMREMFFCLTDKTPSALQSLFCLFRILKSLFTPHVKHSLWKYLSCIWGLGKKKPTRRGGLLNRCPAWNISLLSPHPEKQCGVVQ